MLVALHQFAEVVLCGRVRPGEGQESGSGVQTPNRQDDSTPGLVAVVILTSHSLPGIRWLWFLLGSAFCSTTTTDVSVKAEHF